MEIKRRIAVELRWVFFFCIIPIALWILISIAIEIFGLNSYSCSENETLSYQYSKYTCETPVTKSNEKNSKNKADVWDNAETISLRTADPPYISQSLSLEINLTFLILSLLLYPLSALVRIFVWAFKFKG